MSGYSVLKNTGRQQPGKSPRRSRFPAVLGSRTDLLVLLFLFFPLYTVVLSVQNAGWINPQPSLVLILVLALAAGLVLSRSRLPAPVRHSLAIILGAGVVFLQASLLFQDEGIIARAAHLISDFQAWWRAVKFGEPSPVTVQVALLFGFLAWTIGYFSSWSTVTRRTPWIAIPLSTITILVSLNFQGSHKYIYFIVFIITSLLFFVLLNLIKNRAQTMDDSRRTRGKGWFYWVSISLSIILVTVFTGWNTPQLKIYALQSFGRESNPWREKIELYWQNFFAPVPGTMPGLAHGGPGNIQFGGSLELTDQVVFIVNTNQNHYWKTQVYDYYNTTGWKTGDTRDVQLDRGEISPARSDYQTSDKLTYSLVPQVVTNVLITPGELESADFPITKKELKPLLFTISLADDTGDKQLPEDIAALAAELRSARNAAYRSDRQITSQLPAGFKLVSVERERNQVKTITLSRAADEDEEPVSLNSFEALAAQKPYRISVRLPEEFSPEELMNAGELYPGDITDRYLQLPAGFPSRVRELAEELTSDIDNPYTKALAIKSYLSKIPYSLIIEAPPENADGVEYFLFTQKSGYCVYYASAMAVMLRSIGIPARFVVGYLPGQFDSEQQRFIIRDKDYHAWTEVYFPIYGWVKFDPTPGPAQTSPSPLGDSFNSPPYMLDPYFYDPGIYGDLGEMDSTPQAGSNNYAGYIAGTLFLIVLLAFFSGWFWLYRRPGRNSSLYSRMVRLSLLAGIGPKPWQTAREFSGYLSRVLPEQASGINEITSIYLGIRYGRLPLETAPRKDLTEAWLRLRRTLLKRVFRFR